MAALSASAGAAQAQVRFWDTLTDGVSGTVCDVVNTENAQLLIRTDTGQLQILNAGRDVILADPVVTAEGDVVINGEPVGFIDFQSDADGNRVVWWTSLLGQVVRIDDFSGEPSSTTRLPGDFRNAPCDICEVEELLDDASFCDDGNSDEPPITVRLCGRNVVVSMVGSLMMLSFAALWRRGEL
ncbi:MAG: hypothetical protein HY763_08300 [Planctomycetes bacterium]|nr:hypothetical protein [Planctomycetota bacterium]